MTLAAPRPHSWAGGSAVLVIAAAWVLWMQADSGRCTTSGCLLDGVEAYVLGLPLALAATWLALRWSGALSPIGLLLLLVLVTTIGVVVLEPLELPAMVWPVVLGALTTALLLLQRSNPPDEQ